MTNCTPLWREAHFEVKSVKNLWRFRCVKSAHRCGAKQRVKTQHGRTTFGGSDVVKVHTVVQKAHFKIKMVKTPQGPPPTTTTSPPTTTPPTTTSPTTTTPTTTAFTTTTPTPTPTPTPRLRLRLLLRRLLLLLQLQLQLQHYRDNCNNINHSYSTTTTTLQYNYNCFYNYIALHYTTLHPARVIEVTTATTSKTTTPTIFQSISGFALPSMHHNNSPLL